MSSDLDKLKAKLTDKDWRMANLYLILDESGNQIQIVPRDEQKQFLKDRHKRNFVPKARKLGMSTIIIVNNLDECLFNKDFCTGIIDLTATDAFAKLGIARFCWERGPIHHDKNIAALWRIIHKANPLLKDSSGCMEWSNGSEMSAGVKYVGRTLQSLHISEFGPISAIAPSKATAIKRGAFNCVPPDGIIDIETTMQGGQYGECYELFKSALGSMGKDLTILDWKMHFFSWVNHPSYEIPGGHAQLDLTKEYFEKLERLKGVKVPQERQAWYEKKKKEQGEDMFQQFPTIIEECDMQIVPGQIYREMKTVRAQGRVREFNPEKGYPRFTCWDLGSSDNMAGWEVQPAGKDHNFLAWCAGEGAGAAGVADVIRAWEEKRGPHAGHLVPHDAKITDKGSGKTYIDQMVECGIPRSKIIVVPRIPDMWVGVAEVRRVLPNSYFHIETDVQIETITGAKLPSGVGRIEGYRKKIDHSTGITRDSDVHDICSHTADAVRTYAEALSRDLVKANVVRSGNDGVVVMTGYRGK
jgi:hypothetical protein